MSRRIDDFPTAAVMIRRAEWVVAIAATAILVGLHLTFLLSAGALWRDEVDCVNFSSVSSSKETWANLQFQSFPLLWATVLRGWLTAVPGVTDFRIRMLGLLIGLGVIAILWRNGRALGHSVPLVALTLLGFNAAVIVYGDSIRGYGLGILTGLAAFGFVWRAVDTPTPGLLAGALVSSVVAVHCLYYNVVFVFAACSGGLAVSIKRKARRPAFFVLGVGTISALSLLIYADPASRARAWNNILQTEINGAVIWSKVEETFAGTGGAVLWVWVGVAALALVYAIRAGLTRDDRGLSDRERDAALYCGVTLLTGLSAYLLFLNELGYLMQPWYFVALMALVAACLDAPLSLLARTPTGRIARLSVLVAVMLLAIHPVWRAVRTRRTNVDLIAAKVGGRAVKGDLIVVNPWYLGITFERYYRGAADWITIPPIASHGLHRYDLLKEKMISIGAMAPVLEGMRNALAEGHRVFWVGDLFIPNDGEVPAEPPPAPGAPWGWADAPYYEAWGRQAGALIKFHSRAGARIEVPLSQAVNAYEDAPSFEFSGWWEGEGVKER